MLSKSIKKTVDALESALELGEPIDFATQLRMVRLMGRWEAMACQMELRDQSIYPPTRGFGRPVLVGGSDHEPNLGAMDPEEALQHVLR